MTLIKEITDQDFVESIKEGKILVDFWAPWCGPCRMMAPVLEELAQEVSEVSIAKVNVDDNPQVAAKFGIMSIPTMVLFSDGREVERIVGFVDKQTLQSKLS